MHGRQDWDFSGKLLIKVTRIRRRRKLRDKRWRNTFMIDIVEIHGSKVWMFHYF